MGDEELAKRAIDILARETKIPGGSVQVKVEKGWITLSGEVEWLFQKTTAENAIYKLTEAVGVINRIEVKPKVRSQDVMNRIECALERSADLGPQRITVHVDGTHVILRCNVRSWHEREAAERAARSFPGVSDVDDELVII